MAQVSRRDFLKAGSAGIAGVALSSLGLGTILGAEPANTTKLVETAVPVETFVYVERRPRILTRWSGTFRPATRSRLSRPALR